MINNLANKNTSLHLLIDGHVQGVGFRNSTQHKAIQLNLTGWVKNLNDGKVELFAQGTKKNIEIFHKWCQHGPTNARVKTCQQLPAINDLAELSQTEKIFKIEY